MANFDKFTSWFDAIDMTAMEIGNDQVSSRFADIFDTINGCCGSHTLALINYLVSECLDEDEVYCELGAYCGRTLIAAMRNNNERAVCIDPLIYDNSAIELYQNIERYNLKDRTVVHKQLWQDFITGDEPLHSWKAGKIGIFLNDGDHGTDSTYESLDAFKPLLAQRSIIVVDDMEMEPVQIDVDKWMKDNQKHIAFYRHAKFYMGQGIIGYEN